MEQDGEIWSKIVCQKSQIKKNNEREINNERKNANENVNRKCMQIVYTFREKA